MLNALASDLPPELVGFLVTLGLALLIGIEREEHHPSEDFEGSFGGVRTFPIFGLAGYLLVVAFPGSVTPFAVGLVVLGGWLALAYWSSIRRDPGLTTEAAALLTFTLGGAAAHQLYWLSAATAVVAVILLQEKKRLEALATRLPRAELRTAARFLLLSAVILPIVPDVEFTPYRLNPFTIWLVVVAVSAISYASYLLKRLWGGRGALLVAGILGGAYSSTATTVALARRSRKDAGADDIAYAGAILAATGVMYVRLWLLIFAFAPLLAARLTLPFWGLGLTAVAVAAVLTRRRRERLAEASDPDAQIQTSNPLELVSAFSFAGLFTVVLVATRFISTRFGDTGLLVLAGVMGAADVDPFILGLTQQVDGGLALPTATLAVILAVAVNNLMKGVYALAFGRRRAGTIALALLALWGAGGFAALALT